MVKQSFKTMTAVSFVFLILSVLSILLVCVVPRLIVRSLYNENAEPIRTAISASVKGDNVKARKEILKVTKSLDSKKKLLMFFYDHNAVTALTGAAETALWLSETDEKAQLAAELRGIERAFESLMLTDEISLKSIF